MKRIASLLFVVALTACGSKDAAKFEGRWQEVSRPTSVLVVERNGDEFIISETSSKPNFRPASPKPAKFEDGKLVIMPNAMGAAFTYVKDRDSLILSSAMGSAEYRRVK